MVVGVSDTLLIYDSEIVRCSLPVPRATSIEVIETLSIHEFGNAGLCAMYMECMCANPTALWRIIGSNVLCSHLGAFGGLGSWEALHVVATT